MFIRHQRSENSPATTQHSLAKFCLFPERPLLFNNNSPVTLHYSPATTILNENPAKGSYLGNLGWPAFIRMKLYSSSGTDPGFFLGGGAPVGNGVTDFFFAEYQLY